MGLADDLDKLKTLREQGALTEEEFILAKKRVIDGDPLPPPQARPAPPTALQEFRRSLRDRWIGGVCGGLAASTSVPAWSWRILFVLLAFLHGVGIVLYILMWIFVPLERLALPAPVATVAPVPPASSSPPSPPPAQS